MSNSSLIKAYSNLLLDVYPRDLMPLVFARGEGCRLFDVEGNAFLDFAGANGVNSLGISHPKILEVAHDQIDKIVQTGNYFYNEPQFKLAEKLTKLSGLSKVFFSNSGAEALETAIKIARRFGNSQTQKRSTILCFQDAWHGRTLGTISATDNQQMQKGFEPLLPGFKCIKPFSMDSVKDAVDESVVGIMCEPIIGHGGISLPPKDFFKELRKFCDDKGLLLILDEVQTGVGRTGTFFYFEQLGILPDIVTLAKGLGCGFPIGATICTDEVAKFMDVGSHGSATGGNALSCAVANNVVEIVSDKEFLKTVNKISTYFLNKLKELQKSNPDKITAVRGHGLLAAMDIKASAPEALTKLSKSGLLVTRVGPNTLRFLPPLIITESEIDEGMKILKGV